MRPREVRTLQLYVEPYMPQHSPSGLIASGGAGQQEVARRWRVVLRYRERGTGIKRSEENAL